MTEKEALIAKNGRAFITHQLFEDRMRLLEYCFSPKLFSVRKMFKKADENDYKLIIDLAMTIEKSRGYAIKNRARSIVDDRLFFLKYGRPSSFKPVKAELAIVVIARNEGSYIKEWVSFYELMGVDHIYYIDNGSTDDTKAVLKDYIDSQFVTYISLKGEKAQLTAYRYVLRRIRKKTKWVAFIDADEFLYTKEGSIKDFLKEFDGYPGVGVNWVVYGHCGHEKRPEGYVTDNYTKTFEDRDNELNLRIKTIAQASEVWDIKSPHYAVYRKGRMAVDENKKPIDGSNMLIPGAGRAITAHNSINRIRINHYWTKSLEELGQKCRRGYADGRGEPQYKWILERLDYPLIEDDELSKRFKKLRAAVEAGKGNINV